MPTINLGEKKERNNNRVQTDTRKLRQKAYNDSRWKKIRNLYIKEHPLCEKCMEKGVVTPAQDIHHVKSPFKDNEVNMNLLLNYNNLMALCRECHGDIHSKQQKTKTPQQIIEELDALLNKKN